MIQILEHLQLLSEFCYDKTDNLSASICQLFYQYVWVHCIEDCSGGQQKVVLHKCLFILSVCAQAVDHELESSNLTVFSRVLIL